jgi:predicted NAD/FAD-binding protein
VKVAVVGAGVSGLVAAWLLHREHEVTVFAADPWAGGHTHTVDVPAGGRTWAVDTGFIVFNEVTYPNFCAILARLGVSSQPTRMTFSVVCERTGLEYNAHSLRTLFAQRRNLVDPSFWRMLLDIFRFRREFASILDAGGEERPLLPYLRSRGYSRRFLDHFIVPLASSLWSAPPGAVEEFPLQTLVRFFRNHGFLNVRNPFPWKVIRGGSRQYVHPLTQPFADRLRLGAPVVAVRRFPDRVELEVAGAGPLAFEHVVLATHSDQALALLDDPSEAEREVLGAIPYQENRTTLHIDARQLPERERLWAAWNYRIPRNEGRRAVLTYDMNILQSLAAPEEFCVTLNRAEAVDRTKVLGEWTYHHPVYTPAAPAAQARHAEISGENRTHYCGAYWGYGFHEDGVKSALAACRWFGLGLP